MTCRLASPVGGVTPIIPMIRTGMAAPLAPDVEQAHVTLGVRGQYGSAPGPNPGGGMRGLVAASYAEAIRNSAGSANGLAKNMPPSGSFAGPGPPKRVPSRAVVS